MGGRLTLLAILARRAYYGGSARFRKVDRGGEAMVSQPIVREAVIAAITAAAFFGAVALVSDGDIGGWFDKYIVLWN